MEKTSPLRNQNGMMLVQVIAMSVVLLGVLFMGFRSVQTTIQLSNSRATTATFKDLVLALEQNLSVTQTCLQRLGMVGVGMGVVTSSGTNGYAVSVKNAAGTDIVVEEAKNSPNNFSNDFRILEVRLRNVALRGWPAGAVPGAGSQELERYSGELNIVVERNSQFLGGARMTAAIPLVFGVNSIGTIQFCTHREVYTTELGPKTLPAGLPAGWVRKTALECIDRGGQPTIAAGTDFHSCRIPVSSYGACDGGANTNLPGWHCMIPTAYPPGDPASGFTYAY